MNITGGGRLQISTHVPRVGDDMQESMLYMVSEAFQPTSPVWGTTLRHWDVIRKVGFQPTSPVWGTTGGGELWIWISTHFNPRPPCGGRPVLTATSPHQRDFNPRPPCGGRPPLRSSSTMSPEFQPTSPVWGTTLQLPSHSEVVGFQPTSPVWGTTWT